MASRGCRLHILGTYLLNNTDIGRKTLAFVDGVDYRCSSIGIRLYILPQSSHFMRML